MVKSHLGVCRPVCVVQGEKSIPERCVIPAWYEIDIPVTNPSATGTELPDVRSGHAGAAEICSGAKFTHHRAVRFYDVTCLSTTPHMPHTCPIYTQLIPFTYLCN